MSLFIKQMRESGFIQHLRKQIPTEDLEKFDQMVENKIKEYDELWQKVEPTITNYNEEVADARSNESKSESESRFDDKLNDE